MQVQNQKNSEAQVGRQSMVGRRGVPDGRVELGIA
jgi:hypothetical protein